MDWEMFLRIHEDLPRQGPGLAADVAWVRALSGLSGECAICDAAAGTGGDIAPLRHAFPDARLLAFDGIESFVERMRDRVGALAGVTLRQDDLARIAGMDEAPFDMIWCAGALYFLGLDRGLATMREALKPGGVLAFSEPCFFTDTPSPSARAFWEDHPTRTEGQIATAIAQAGFETLGARRVSDAGWEAYYGPLEARIAALRGDATPRLEAMLDHCAAEPRKWRSVRHETGYLLSVVRRG